MQALELLEAVPGAQLVGGDVFIFDEAVRTHVLLAHRAPGGVFLTPEGEVAVNLAKASQCTLRPPVEEPAPQAEEPAKRRGRRAAIVAEEAPEVVGEDLPLVE